MYISNKTFLYFFPEALKKKGQQKHKANRLDAYVDSLCHGRECKLFALDFV